LSSDTVRKIGYQFLHLKLFTLAKAA